MPNWPELGRMLTTSIVCLTPVLAWAEYRRSSSKDLKFENTQTHESLVKIEKELDQIAKWTGKTGRYDENSHNNNWYDPGWSVREFNWNQIRQYIYTLSSTRGYKELNKSLAGLGTAIETFNNHLESHKEYVDSIKHSTIGPIADKVREGLSILRGRSGYRDDKKASDLLVLAPKLNVDFDHESLAIIGKIYASNKTLHTKLIGNESLPESLFAKRKVAEEKVDKSIKERKNNGNLIQVVGDLLALLFACSGLVFLYAFLASSLGKSAAIVLTFALITAIPIWAGLRSRSR